VCSFCSLAASLSLRFMSLTWGFLDSSYSSLSLFIL